VTPEAGERWLAAGVLLGRLGPLGPEGLAEGAGWLLALLAERPEVPPPGAVLDLGRLLLGGPPPPPRPLPVLPAPLRAAVRAYEEALLDALAAERRVEAAGEALGRLAPAARPAALGYALSRLLGRVLPAGGVDVAPGLVRRVLARPVEELAREGSASLQAQDAACAALTEGYAALAQGARRAGALLTDADVFVLEHWGALRGSAERLALEQAAEAAGHLLARLPERPRPRHAREGAQATALDDEASYPTGGFSSVATSGSIENLVASELAYMDVPAEGDAPEMDLFDVRYVEGELLYYTRDESVFVRRRRHVTLAFLADLALARVKDPGERYQRLVLLLGAVKAVLERLAHLLREEDLAVRLAFVADGDGAQPLAPERGLAALLLSELCERGVVRVDTADGLAALAGELEAGARRERGHLVVLSARPQQAPVERVPTTQVTLASERPAVAGEASPTWEAAACALLECLL
jgi:hypothetical protein